jgi:hypothetical protein
MAPFAGFVLGLGLVPGAETASIEGIGFAPRINHRAGNETMPRPAIFDERVVRFFVYQKKPAAESVLVR